MTVTLANLNFMWQQVIMPRCGDVYVFGGSLDPQNLRQGTDCTGAGSEVNEAILYGPQMNWNRQFWTGTFAGAQPGDRGPFDGVECTRDWVCIDSPDHPPPGAVATFAVLQLPDPSEAHMVCCALDPQNVTGFGGPGVYVGIESGGSFTDANGNSTLHIGPLATGVNNPEFNQWFALDHTIAGQDVPPPPAPSPLTTDQLHALLIIDAGKAQGINVLGQQMGLCCALDESNMRMLANASVPESLQYDHVGVGSDHGSCGPFQQQHSQGWGTVACEMDWTCSAGLFFTALARTDYNDPDNTPGWRIQQVQRSFDSSGSNYDARWDDAVALYNSVINLPSSGDDMAQVPQDQWDTLFSALCTPVVSASPFRALGEGPRWTVAQLMHNQDGATHPEAVEWAAGLGDPVRLAELQQIATANITQYPDRIEDIRLAQATLARLQSGGGVIVSPAVPPVTVGPTADSVTAPTAPAVPASVPGVVSIKTSTIIHSLITVIGGGLAIATWVSQSFGDSMSPGVAAGVSSAIVMATSALDFLVKAEHKG